MIKLQKCNSNIYFSSILSVFNILFSDKIIICMREKCLFNWNVLSPKRSVKALQNLTSIFQLTLTLPGQNVLADCCCWLPAPDNADCCLPKYDCWISLNNGFIGWHIILNALIIIKHIITLMLKFFWPDHAPHFHLSSSSIDVLHRIIMQLRGETVYGLYNCLHNIVSKNSLFKFYAFKMHCTRFHVVIIYA